MIYLLMIMLAFIDPEMSSKKASFDGKNCILEEDVVLDHPFGRLKTHKATLEKSDSDKMSFDKVSLQGQVEVFLASGATLTGLEAVANLDQKHLLFSGQVIYQEPGGIRIHAHEAEADFQEKDEKYCADLVSAKGDVIAFFPDGRRVSCQKATYKPRAFYEIEGFNDKPCELIDKDLNLKTTKGYFDLMTEKGYLQQVTAHLIMPVSGIKSIIKLQADEIIFSEKTHIIESDKKTSVEAEAYSLKSDLKQFKVKLGANQEVKEAFFDGYIHIMGPHGQKLECPGVLRMHEEKQILVLKAHPNQFVSCSTDDLLVKAKRSRIFYKQESGKFIAIKLELEDDVQLFDLREGKKIFGKAQVAHLFLEDQRLQLYGDAQKRVLYVDESIDFHLSAPEVVVRKNDQGKLSVQGIGAVRFSFNDEEKSLIEKLKKM